MSIMYRIWSNISKILQFHHVIVMKSIVRYFTIFVMWKLWIWCVVHTHSTLQLALATSPVLDSHRQGSGHGVRPCGSGTLRGVGTHVASPQLVWNILVLLIVYEQPVLLRRPLNSPFAGSSHSLEPWKDSLAIETRSRVFQTCPTPTLCIITEHWWTDRPFVLGTALARNSRSFPSYGTWSKKSFLTLSLLMSKTERLDSSIVLSLGCKSQPPGGLRHLALALAWMSQNLWGEAWVLILYIFCYMILKCSWNWELPI